MNPKTIFKWVLMDIIPSISSKSLTKDTTFAYCFLIMDAYSQIPKLYGMENITTEEVVENLDLFQARFGKVDGFGWCYMERIQTDASVHFTSYDFQEVLYVRGV